MIFLSTKIVFCRKKHSFSRDETLTLDQKQLLLYIYDASLDLNERSLAFYSLSFIIL